MNKIEANRNQELGRDWWIEPKEFSGFITHPNHVTYSSELLAHTGVKYDDGKPRYDLLSPELLEEISLVLGYGAKKYADRNWELGMDWGRPFAASMRHLWAWWRGEENDPESGLSHLSHALCCIMFLLVYTKRNLGKDTRNACRTDSLPTNRSDSDHRTS